MIGFGEMPFAFGPPKFAGGSIDAHLLILPRVRLSLIRVSGPVRENVAPKRLEVKFSFPRGTEEAFPRCFVHDGHNATTTTHVLVVIMSTCTRTGRVVTLSVVTW